MSVTFRGEVLAQSRGAYAAVISPFVALKKFFQTLHRLAAELLWSELINNKASDHLVAFTIFLIFCILSLLAYYCRAFSGLLFYTIFLLWLFDSQFARRQFLHGKQTLITALECRGDWIVWQRQGTDGQTEHMKFQVAEVAQISITRTFVRGGAFQEILGTAWQVYVTLLNQTELLFYESCNATAFTKAKQLSQFFAVPLVVLGSQGAGHDATYLTKYAAESIGLEVLHQSSRCKTIRCEQSLYRWHIYSQWRLSSAWRLLKEILHRFGFLLFAVILVNLMIPFGSLLHVVGSAVITMLTKPPIQYTFSFSEILFPTFHWQTGLELVLALSVLIFKGAQLSREEHLYVTPKTLTFFLGTHKIAQLPTSAIEAILFLKQPFPSLLILTNDQILEIRELQHETEFCSMLLQLNQALVALMKQA